MCAVISVADRKKTERQRTGKLFVPHLHRPNHGYTCRNVQAYLLLISLKCVVTEVVLFQLLLLIHLTFHNSDTLEVWWDL